MTTAETNPQVEYWDTVRAIAEDIAGRCRSGDCDDIHDAIHEDVDGNHYVIYTHASYEVRQFSDHWGECEDDVGWSDLCSQVNNLDALVTLYAFHAMKADVEDALREIDGFDPDDPDSWTATTDEDEDPEQDDEGDDLASDLLDEEAEARAFGASRLNDEG